MTIMTVTARRTCRAVTIALGKGREPRIGRGMGRRLRMGRGKGMGREREMVKGKVWLNTLQGEMISLVPWLGICRMKCQRQTCTLRAN
jgi:hypothetical protein